jgi:membrane-bound serine protease (ClpP class)
MIAFLALWLCVLFVAAIYYTIPPSGMRPDIYEITLWILSSCTLATSAIIIVVSLVIAGFIVFASRKALAAHRDEPVRTGSEELIGSVAEVREPLDPEGQVFVAGALWRARVSDGGPVGLGNRVRIKAVDGLTLEVEPVADRDPASVEKGT